MSTQKTGSSNARSDVADLVHLWLLFALERKHLPGLNKTDSTCFQP